MNELLFFVSIILSFSSVVLIAKYFGSKGLFAWIALLSVLANLIVAKQVTIFGLEVTLGNILFSSTYLITDIISETYGLKTSKKAVIIGVLAECFFIGTTQIALLFTPNELDLVQASMANLFSMSLRITIASIAMYLLGNFADIYLFDALKKKTSDKLWLRNNVATILCNCLQNILFNIFAFWGTYDFSTCLKIGLGTCVIVIIISICDTPFVYLGRKFARKEDI